MKNRIIAALIGALLLLAAIPTARALEFSDINDHWAEAYIETAVSLHLFDGVGDGIFDPEGTMSRGMFVTVLGRLDKADMTCWSSAQAPALFSDVAAGRYYTPYISWAACSGFVDGMGNGQFAPDGAITREQMAKLIVGFAQQLGYQLKPAQDAVPDSFADSDQISGWAAVAVETLRDTGILRGVRNADGTYSFNPQATATRAECATVFCRLVESLEKPDEEPVVPQSISLSAAQANVHLGEYYPLAATVLPAQVTNPHVAWHSSDLSVVRVDGDGLVTCVGFGSATVTAFTSNGLRASCTFTCEEDLGSADETYTEKCYRIFGKVVDEPRLYYTDAGVDAARSDMVTLSILVWDFDNSGAKVTKTMKLTVHKNIARTVQVIFEEIYNGDEKFPIHYVGGFAWVGKSEHSIGCAIDINPNENFYCDPDGNAIVGSYWKPGEDPYSIPPNGDVVNAFAAHGFTQGIYWRSGYKDYMHFSYFAT